MEWLKKNKKKLIIAIIAALVSFGLLNNEARTTVLNLLDKVPGMTAPVDSGVAPVNSAE